MSRWEFSGEWPDGPRRKVPREVIAKKLRRGELQARTVDGRRLHWRSLPWVNTGQEYRRGAMMSKRIGEETRMRIAVLEERFRRAKSEGKWCREIDSSQ